jgi:pimeloyl-ACP methyl ester carboxylesterase
MPTFDSNGVAINYIDEGAGPAIVLVHGFAAHLESNWRGPGIVDALLATGRRVVALDCRGHGKSAKPHDPEAYADNAMALDVIALMDHLRIAKADLLGYSMGGIISSWLLTNYEDRFRTVILSGIGDALVSHGRDSWRERGEAMADAMESGSPAISADETARNFRILAERTGNDLSALAAMQRAPRRHSPVTDFSGVTIPVMVLLGEGDVLVGKADKLAAAITGSKLVYVPGDHLTAVVKPELKTAIVDFLATNSPVTAH